MLAYFQPPNIMFKFLSSLKFLTRRSIEAVVFLVIFFGIFGMLGHKMGLANMMNTLMSTAFRLLTDTVFYIMGITVLTGALSKLLIEFGVIRLLEVILKPFMRPLYNLPGVAALGGLLTFLSDNPAIIAMAQDRNFSRYFKKYQLISLTNFGTAFGMGFIVIIFMASQGFGLPAVVGLFGSFVGSVVSTRLMQRSILKAHPELASEIEGEGDEQKISFRSEQSLFLRILNSLLDGGKSGVDLGLAIIPGVLVISTFVMLLTFGPSTTGEYTGAAYEGIALLPWLADKVSIVFEWLFGFHNPELVAFPITALGAVGAALGLVPRFVSEGIVDGNAIAVFTAMGMCWSGYLSTHTAMLDSLGYRNLTSKAIGAHTLGGLCAGIAAHFMFMLVSLVL